jgi:hypothetical protein
LRIALERSFALIPNRNTDYFPTKHLQIKPSSRWLIKLTLFFVCVLAPAACLTPQAFGQGLARPDGSVPVPLDWTSKHVLFPAGFTPEQAEKMRNEPRAYTRRLLHSQEPTDYPRLWRRPPMRPRRANEEIGRDWAVSLGGGGVAPGMSPAKYTFDVNATPNCTSDFVVFPVDASTGNARANVVGTFTAEPQSGATASITVTPTGGSATTLTLTSSATLNTGLDFLISATVATNATNLAAAINRNLSNTALDRVVAVASGSTVTVYVLTPGSGVTLTDAETLNNFSWGAVTAGTNGTQANIVGFNQLYSGSGTPLCGHADPEFIFSYASGVGPVATSPNISLSGTKISYVENDPNIGAILHVLTFGSGSTEYGAACATSNNGTAMPTCATNPVIPGSTANSTATDFMLPLGLVAANAATGAAGAPNSFSSPFIDYSSDVTFVGDNNGYLYAITPTFNSTPGYAGGNFPVHVSSSPTSVAPTAVTATTTVVTVTAANSLATLELVTIAGVTPNAANGCTAADAAAINGIQTVVSASGTQFTFDATIPSATTGTGCTVTGATVTPGTNYLSAPVVDVSGTGNIFVGDSSANLYELTPTGTTAATSLSVGENANGGIRDAPIIDSTNAVGYVVTACTTGTTGGETDTTNAALIQFKFTSSTLTEVAAAGLDSGANQSCSVAGFPMYDPTPDARYFVLGIGSATAANNGEIITASSGTGGQQLKAFQFVSFALQTTPDGTDKPQLGTGPSVVSPLTEFFNSQEFTVTRVTATTTVVTVRAANTLAANDMVTLSGVTADSANNCTAADVGVINGGLQTVATASATQFTFDATIPTATAGTGCTVTGATATGGPDYMFMGVEQNPAELYSILLPGGVLVAGTGNPPTTNATNTADVAGGTSAIIVDNDSTDAQASSLYFGTLATSTTICGTTAAYCAIKVTQGALQ